MKYLAACLGVAALLIVAAAITGLGPFAGNNRNAFQLPGTPYFPNGYEWWWHSFVAYRRSDGAPRPFFIEYFVINPGLGGAEPVLSSSGRPQSYARMIAGTWGEHHVVLQSTFPVADFAASLRLMDVAIGANRATNSELHGQVVGPPSPYGGPAERLAWDLKAEKVLSYDIGFLGGRFFQWLGAFDMLWHVPGMQTRYSGTVEWNDDVYDVDPARSSGYQDKNWGKDYTAPWYWLSCNSFTSRVTGKPLPLTSLDLGGGMPRAFGIPLCHDKLLIALYYKGVLHEWNFTHLLDLPREDVRIEQQPGRVSWQVAAEDSTQRIEIDFTNPTSEMVQLVYENPRGLVPLSQLWNGGTASGTVRFYVNRAGRPNRWELVDSLEGTFGQGEFGIPATSR